MVDLITERLYFENCIVYYMLNNMGTVFLDSVMLSRNRSLYNLDLSHKPFIKENEGLATVIKCLSEVGQVWTVISVGSL